MVFNSLNYIFVFLPLAVVGYYLLRKTAFGNLFMLCISLFFYVASAIWYLVPMLFTALIDYILGQKIQNSDDSSYRKRLLIISVIANIGLLSVFKYTGWLSNELATLLALFGVGLVSALSFINVAIRKIPQ
jgi:alginate O-acetyltransferase complex protein AlgI